MNKNIGITFAVGFAGAIVGASMTMLMQGNFSKTPSSPNAGKLSIGVLDVNKIIRNKAKSLAKKGVSGQPLKNELARFVVYTGMVLKELPKDLVLFTPGVIESLASVKDYTDELAVKIDNFEPSDEPTKRRK